METFTIDHPAKTAEISVSVFKGNGPGDEYHIMISDSERLDIRDQLGALEEAYAYALETLRLRDETAVFRRIFASDLANQHEILSKSKLADSATDRNPVAVSMVEQPPLPGRRYALWAYHVSDCTSDAKARFGNSVVIERGALTHLWSAGLAAPVVNETRSSFDQTEQLFAAYEAQLGRVGAGLRDNVVRTWLFVQNVDNNYAGMVEARRELFEARGLSRETHYIASTGIEGRHANRWCNVLMDAYAVAGIDEAQIRYLTAGDHLGPTIDYGVTFERGTGIDYRDRRHVLISGTASIDPSGNTLHRGDIIAQTERAVKNAASLLRNAGAALSDLAHLIVYLRDPADCKLVTCEIKTHFPTTPTVFLRAPVCRPEWLVEIECMAIIPADNPDFAPF